MLELTLVTVIARHPFAFGLLPAENSRRGEISFFRQANADLQTQVCSASRPSCMGLAPAVAYLANLLQVSSDTELPGARRQWENKILRCSYTPLIAGCFALSREFLSGFSLEPWLHCSLIDYVCYSWASQRQQGAEDSLHSVGLDGVYDCGCGYANLHSMCLATESRN